ncbi:efflux RND transporter periplasmic adaptor subunit [Diaphorobacter ruginosibacter]|uniref:efflux RND transporter periplasmic adaptor subunit n=1 Tax=Diaphorobacter ruginosibacter TaxID=1715720 RepID=UPI003342B020
MHPVYEANQTSEGYSCAYVFRRSRSAALVFTLVAAMGLSACGDKNAGQQAGQGQQKPPEVGVVTVELQNVPIVSDLPGRLEASRVAQVRARAAGIVQKRLFKEGSDVKAGQVLFQIDDTPYKANLQSAQATLAQAEANLAQAASTARRYKPLVEANAISKQEYDVAVANEKAGQAQVAAGKAAVTNANVSLGYATVTAPISGRIGRALVTEGALVGQGDATQLAVIQQINPMYVNITQSSSEILRMRQALASGKLSSDGKAGARVTVFTDDGRKIPQEGRLLFTDLTVDETTGQVQVRAEIPNPDGLLLPGMYVRVHLEQAQIDNAMVIPQQSVTRNEKGNFVMVVGEDGSVSPRPVQISQSQGTNWVVTSGLKPGEKVMVDGLVKVGMGAKKVTPVPWTGTSQPQPAQQPASAASAPASAASEPASAASSGK